MLQYDRKKVGDHLKLSREKAKLTQAEVAERLGYSTSQFISNIERGVSVAPLDALSKMLRLYKTKPTALEKIILSSQEDILLRLLKREGRKPSSLNR